MTSRMQISALHRYRVAAILIMSSSPGEDVVSASTVAVGPPCRPPRNMQTRLFIPHSRSRGWLPLLPKSGGAPAGAASVGR
jgi:hypothetical protein